MTRNDGAFEVWVVACKDAEITWIILSSTPTNRPWDLARPNTDRDRSIGAKSTESTPWENSIMSIQRRTRYPNSVRGFGA
jgi:hypothetical protein